MIFFSTLNPPLMGRIGQNKMHKRPQKPHLSFLKTYIEGSFLLITSWIILLQSGGHRQHPAGRAHNHHHPPDKLIERKKKDYKTWLPKPRSTLRRCTLKPPTNPIRNLLSSITPFRGHKDNPVLDNFRVNSERRQQMLFFYFNKDSQ